VIPEAGEPATVGTGHQPEETKRAKRESGSRQHRWLIYAGLSALAVVVVVVVLVLVTKSGSQSTATYKSWLKYVHPDVRYESVPLADEENAYAIWAGMDPNAAEGRNQRGKRKPQISQIAQIEEISQIED
jgi:hypothetical protein